MPRLPGLYVVGAFGSRGITWAMLAARVIAAAIGGAPSPLEASLLDAIDHSDASGISMYGGGQFELGVGRAHIQTLASLFYPEAPNDVAPGEYNEGGPRPGLPQSPLPAPDRRGL